MCGFVGFINRIDNSNVVLEKMMDRIKHRGPDAEGSYIDSNIALGHRRLSIIDVSSQGDQPIYNEDSSMVLVFNGEIYNYKKIREKLVEAGHVFKTNTDSEVLIHGYEEYGVNLLNMLRGMFSFIIWDKNKKELLQEIEKLPIYQNGKGVCIGNMVSQIVATFYLDKLDKYIENVLGIKAHVRYMDDFYCMHQNKSYLKRCLEKIKDYLKEFKLTLNSKTKIYSSTEGIEVLGFVK